MDELCKVFGFGSLMADGWEKQFDCVSKERATLNNYRRAFVKPSIKRWGSKECPAPTLDIELGEGAQCEGMLFSFPIENAAAVKSYLEKREGKDFPLSEVTLSVSDDRKTSALVAIYAGKDRIAGSPSEIVQMASKAKGQAGGGLDYINTIAATLDEQGIADSAVAMVMAEIARLADKTPKN